MSDYDEGQEEKMTEQSEGFIVKQWKNRLPQRASVALKWYVLG